MLGKPKEERSEKYREYLRQKGYLYWFKRGEIYDPVFVADTTIEQYEDEVLDRLQELWLELSDEERDLLRNMGHGKDFYLRCDNCGQFMVNILDPQHTEKHQKHIHECPEIKTAFGVPEVDVSIVSKDREEE